MVSKVLIIGACGQIGSELTNALRILLGVDNVIASDIRESNEALVASGPFEIIDAKDFEDIKKNVLKHNIETIYLMAAMLSATGEKYPEKAWDLNMTSLFNVLNLAKENTVKKVFWPSSIAVFGPSTPKINTPQQTVMEPTTVYGITKQVGERWCEYYFNNYGVDVRSIRYPGIISWKTLPGGGTTDYAIDIFHKAISDGHYDCFLNEDTALPMMFMEDAVKATLDIMNANTNDVKIRSSYNLSAISFTPQELAAEIAKQIPEFTISYTPDFRQKIADSWPNSIDDSSARQDWNWNHSYDLEAITNEMLLQLKEKAIS
ncbi:NAD-dependent epimerase/dehydratase family protein [Flavobacteriaceae bacterium S0862]|nr:NAD-dependent epimerase/dehydratase family protein [Flavobacteriaceae bacterium S0862]